MPWDSADAGGVAGRRRRDRGCMASTSIGCGLGCVSGQVGELEGGDSRQRRVWQGRRCWPRRVIMTVAGKKEWPQAEAAEWRAREKAGGGITWKICLIEDNGWMAKSQKLLCGGAKGRPALRILTYTGDSSRRSRRHRRHGGRQCTVYNHSFVHQTEFGVS